MSAIQRPVLLLRNGTKGQIQPSVPYLSELNNVYSNHKAMSTKWLLENKLVFQSTSARVEHFVVDLMDAMLFFLLCC